MLLPKWSLGLLLASLPIAGCGQKSNPPAPPVVFQSNAPLAIAGTDANESEPEEKPDELADAPAEVIVPTAIPAEGISPAAAEIVKLAQAGVDETVMMAFVTNSTNVFQLTSDNLVYLNDVGVPAAVVTAMLQRDQAAPAPSAEPSVAAGSALGGTNPGATNLLVPAPGAPLPYASAPTPIEQPQPEPVPTETVIEAPAAPDQANVSYTYFYNSLAPYGTWINVSGYGLCWRPTVVAADPGWQPYVNRGRWVYTDCGWYWVSDYSWGWAPFHYGRWFRHNRMGWCWAPDTVWGPAWVSWRYTSDYCGWAPLPPSACYRPGVGFTYYGRSVGFSFGFGLSYSSYCFVPVRNVCDRYVHHHRIPHHRARDVYHHTRPVQRYDRDERNRIVNRGIPVEQVSATSRQPIRPVPTRDIDRPSAPRFEGTSPSDRRLAVYRPRLPEPDRPGRLVGEGVRPAPIRTVPRNSLARPAEPAGPAATPAEPNAAVERTRNRGPRPERPERPNENQPATATQPANPDNPSRVAPRPARDVGPARTLPTVQRGSDRSDQTPAPVVNRPATDRPVGNANPESRPARPNRTNVRPAERSTPANEMARPAPRPVAPAQTAPVVMPTPTLPRVETPAPARPPQSRTVQPRVETDRQPAAQNNRPIYRTESQRNFEAPRRIAPEPRSAPTPVVPRVQPAVPAYQPPVRAIQPSRTEPRFNVEPRRVQPQREVNTSPSMQMRPVAPAPAPRPSMQESRPQQARPAARPERPAPNRERNRDR